LEADQTRLTDEVAERAADVFGVSAKYLTDGVVEGGRDGLAARIETILGAHKLPDMGSDGGPRLRHMRVSLGYQSGRAAARAAGAATATFMAHEGGSRALPVDRMIGYALALGARPEYAVLLDGDMLPSEGEQVDGWRARDDEHPAAEEGLDWRWLNKGVSDSRVALPLVEASDGEFRLLEGGGLSLPRSLLSVAMASQLYGHVERDRDQITIRIVNPGSDTGRVVRAAADGRIAVTAGKDSLPVRDLLRKNSADGDGFVTLGELVMTMLLQG
jgi:hypothetical protein